MNPVAVAEKEGEKGLGFRVAATKGLGFPESTAFIAVSCLTGKGIDVLMDHLHQAVQGIVHHPEGTSSQDVSATNDKAIARSDADTNVVLFTRARHLHHLRECIDALRRYEETPRSSLEIAAEELRRAMRELGKVTGVVDVEEVLENIFSQFCIGK